MARRPWRGTADLNLPDDVRQAVMTICPGQEQQQGTRFRVIMEEAAEKLDRLVIVNAAGLSYHNFKRLIPGDIRHEGALALARIRSSNWLAMNMPHIDDTMGSRCEIVEMEDIAKDDTFKDRSALIRTIYESGPNAVSEWFDYSTGIDINERGPRLSERNGIILKPEIIAANALDYLCDEYAMRSLMWQRWGLDEIYLGLAVRDPGLFQRYNTTRPDLDLSIPPNHEIILTEIVPEPPQSNRDRQKQRNLEPA